MTRPTGPRFAQGDRPWQATPTSPQYRRRQKSAHVAVRKDSMLLETDDGPRVVRGVTKPKVKKR